MGSKYHLVEHRIDSSGQIRPRWVTRDSAIDERKRLRSNLTMIGLWGATVTIPMIFLPALLLGLIFARSTKNDPSSGTEFSFNANETSNPSDSYFVKMNATTLLTVSAWSSTLTPLLGAVLMHLWSYRAAASIFKYSQNRYKMGLPSPYQFALILEMIKGNVTTLLQDLKYIFRWKRRKTVLVSLLKSSMLMLTIVSVLGLLILLADTWLHLETEAFTIFKSLKLIGTSQDGDDGRVAAFVPGSIDRLYAQEVEDAIYTGANSTSVIGLPGYWSTKLQNECGIREGLGRYLPCSIVGGRNYNLLTRYGTVSQFLANSSDSFVPQTTQFADSDTNSTMVIIAPANTRQSKDSSIDFTAYTYGATTTCKPMLKQCDMDLSETSNLTFNCDKAGSTFNHSVIIGNQSSPFENHTLYSDPGYYTPVPWNSVHRGDGDVLVTLPTLDMVNPSYPAVALASFNLQPSDSAAFSFGAQRGSGIVLFCKHTIWDANYTFLNNSWTIRGAVPSNTHVANITNIPLMLGSLQSYFDSRVDGVMITIHEQELADRYATAYSLASMAILAGNLETAPVRSAQVRHRLLVTRVPKAPLFCLVALNLIYAALGLGLTLDALRAVRKNKNLIDVQARLGMAGLTAECFEGDDAVGQKVEACEDLFAEKKGRLGVKIGLRRGGNGISDGGRDKEDGESRGWRLSRYDIEEVQEEKRKARGGRGG